MQSVKMLFYERDNQPYAMSEKHTNNEVQIVKKL